VLNKIACRCAETDGSSWRACGFLVPRISNGVLGSEQGMLAHDVACSPFSVQNTRIVDCISLLMIAPVHW